MGAGTCVAWRKYAPNPLPDFNPDLDLEVFDLLLSKEPALREVLRQIGSSSKLRTVFDNNDLTIGRRTLLKEQSGPSDIRTVLFRIEDVGMEPGRPNVVGFLAIVEPHPDPNWGLLLETFAAVARERDDRGELRRRGMALLAVQCGDELSVASCETPVIGEDGRRSACSDNDVIERVDG